MLLTQCGENFRHARTNGRSNHDFLKGSHNYVSTFALNVEVIEIPTNARKRWLRITSCAHSALSCPCDGNSHKPLRDHWYSEEVEG